MKAAIAGTVLVVTLALAHSAAAQTLGVKIGAAFANLDRTVTSTTIPSGDVRVADDLKRFASAGGGVFLQFGNGVISLQPEGLYLTKGARFMDPATGDEFIRLKLNYFELPVLVKARAPFGLYAFAGPSIAYEGSCLSQQRQTNVKISARCNDQNAAIPHRHPLDYGLHAGAGYRYQIGTRVLLLEARQIWGLRDIDSDDGIEFRNRAFAVMLGYSSAPAPRRRR